jgi:hypothetical protein
MAVKLSSAALEFALIDMAGTTLYTQRITNT